jgi:hypothetical protein
MVEVEELPQEQRPHSPDPDFWNVWTGARPSAVDWKQIVASWTSSLAADAHGKTGLDPNGDAVEADD